MGTNNKKRLIVFIVISTVILLLTSVLSSINNSHGEFFSETDGDTTPPVTSIKYAAPFYEDERGKWINSSTEIWLNATDDYSGVNYTHYGVWCDSNGDGIFEILEKNVTVYDNDLNDSDNSSGSISTYFTISNSCHHRIIFYSVDYAGNVETSGESQLQEQWNYSYQPMVTHCWEDQSFYKDQYKKMVFGSSPAIADLFNFTPEMEIVCGSDEAKNFYPEINASANGLWRCWSSNGDIVWARDTKTDEARSSPAICDIDGDGALEIAAGTTSGWEVEVMDNNGNFLWTFPTLPPGGAPGGKFCWHSSPALADIVDDDPHLNGLELVIGNNPYNNLWCFDGDNSDGTDDGFTLPRDYYGRSPYFPWTKAYGSLGVEGVDWDVLWVVNNSQPIIASPAVADIDNDSHMEVIIGSLDNTVYVIDGATGTTEWSFTTNDSIYSSAAIANIDDDPYLEIVVGSNDTNVYCLQWDGNTGSVEWNFSTGGAVYSSPAIGDVDGDGELDIVVGSLDGSVYCLNNTGSLKWNYTTGGAVYSSPALACDGSLYRLQWPMFRHECARTGFYGYSNGEQSLHVFIGSDDGYLYKLYGTNGSLLSKFLTNGPIHTSPSIADIDGDGAIEILFYDWGEEWGSNDTFWCLEEPNIPKASYVHVDNIPPVTTKKVGGEDEYTVTDETPIWLNGTDDGNCSVGINYLHYEIWWDSNGNDVVDELVVNKTILDNGSGDVNPTSGTISAMFTMDHYGINEIRWFSIDLLGNREAEHYQGHILIVTAPSLTVIKDDNPDPVSAGGMLTYTINVTNSGNEDATNIMVVDDFDESNLSIIDTDGGYNNGDTITWHISNLSPGSYVKYIVSARAKSIMENGTIIYNTVNVTCDEGSTDEDTEPTNVTSAPLMEIDKTAVDINGLYLEPGDKIHYIVYITNTGNMNHHDNPGNELQDYIPAHTTYESGSATSDGGTASYDSIHDMITWNGIINVSETVTIEFNVTVDFPLDNGTLISNDAILHWDSNGNNINDATSHAYANLTVVSSPVLSIEKADSDDPVHPGTFFNYTVTVENNGNANATDVIVKDMYDANVTFISANPSPNVGNNEWHVALLSPGDIYPIEIKVQVHMPLENIMLNNTANVTCTQDATNETYENTQVISAPELIIAKEAIDINGIPLRPEDTIHYIINVTNVGDKNHHDNPGNELQDYIPAHTTYESGSATSDGGTASYDSIHDMITWNGIINVS
ncbi:MAG: FG-GAP-like repeat-containing protein, partial [Candidatus Thermoplasmatota archaeon]|nr:FG-GAP-like repeat-containing protein [Candidatus Thermoplasmatota archaeon]